MNRRTRIAVILCALVIFNFNRASIFAQDLPTTQPDAVGLSSDRLERIATTVQRGIEDQRIAGAVTLVSRRGPVYWLIRRSSTEVQCS